MAWTVQGGEAGGEFREQALGDGGVDLVLDRDVGAVALRILRRQGVGPFSRQAGSELEQRLGFERECDAAAEGLQAGDADGEGREGSGLDQFGGDGGAVGAGQMMEHGDMGGEEVTLGREVGRAEAIQPDLIGRVEQEGQDERVGRWLALTRDVLPGMAVVQRWPIRFDHCFMRVLLDNTLEGVWHHTIKRPAIRHLSPEMLERAIALGERVVAEPALLPELDRRSLAWRRGDRV